MIESGVIKTQLGKKYYEEKERNVPPPERQKTRF